MVYGVKSTFTCVHCVQKIVLSCHIYHRHEEADKNFLTRGYNPYTLGTLVITRVPSAYRLYSRVLKYSTNEWAKRTSGLLKFEPLFSKIFFSTIITNLLDPPLLILCRFLPVVALNLLKKAQKMSYNNLNILNFNPKESGNHDLDTDWLSKIY